MEIELLDLLKMEMEHLEGQSCFLQVITAITPVMGEGDDKLVQASFSVHIRGSL